MFFSPTHTNPPPPTRLSVSLTALSLPLSHSVCPLSLFLSLAQHGENGLTLKGPLFNWKHLGNGGAAVVGCRGYYGISISSVRDESFRDTVGQGSGVKMLHDDLDTASSLVWRSVATSCWTGGGNPAALFPHNITNSLSSPPVLCVYECVQKLHTNLDYLVIHSESLWVSIHVLMQWRMLLSKYLSQNVGISCCS